MLAIRHLADFPEYIETVAAWGHGQWGYLDPRQTLEDRVSRLKGYMQHDAIPMTFIALDDGVPVGTASIEAHDMEDRPELTPWLSSVYVPAEFRRRGIGSMLVNRVVDEAGRLGVEEIFLFTFDQRRLYEGLGWQVKLQDTYRGWPVTVMKRRLR